MDNKLAEFLTDEKYPKGLRYLVLAAVIAFVDGVLLTVAAVTQLIVVKVLFALIAVLLLAVCVWLAAKIHRS